ncbi:MAG: tRNA (N(6)-L-threonylcarbamoyladenosine(37)-C(2))-methylthiotransferase MtaB [Bacteroidales bacterium]|jgi:threonylcarbamoyladenosine tRNA methylthiotransferase MtaB|nr:tRNA (N(6)-L-threonylcarbamoyladenosine(37)-C(2))-methylthiotransferase MtaB [Bacteroidales bacterium]
MAYSGDKGKKVAFHTLGCKLNFSETSTISRNFKVKGFDVVSFNSEADIYVINTCSVTEQADKKCRQSIKKIQNKNPEAFIAVVGCYAQLKPEEIAKNLGVDLVLGTKEKFNILEHLDNLQKNEKPEVHSCEIAKVADFDSSHSESDRTRSFLKVQDGCDYSCSYCTIPLARGKSRNKKISDLVLEAEKIAESGIKEIILTGVNIGDFGKSTKESFFELIKSIEKVNGIERIRISSIEPNLLSYEIIEFVSLSNKILPHFHIPLQSGCNKILAKMQRRYKRELFKSRVDKIKQLIPDAFIGVDVIVGFPDETDHDFNETYQFLEDIDASFYHVFSYSERPNTKSASFENKIPRNIISARSKKLHELANKKLSNFYAQNLGKEGNVLFEASKKDSLMYGFTENYIKVETEYNISLVGAIKKVKLGAIAPSGNVSVKMS